MPGLQAGWGKCNEAFMSGYCAKSCNRCSSAATCSDTPPNGQYTCAQQVRAATQLQVCLKHLLHHSYAAVLMQHVILFPYKQIMHSSKSSITWLQAGWGKCNESFMKDNNFCQITCGRCSSCSDTPPDSKYTCAQQVCINWQPGCSCCTHDW